MLEGRADSIVAKLPKMNCTARCLFDGAVQNCKDRTSRLTADHLEDMIMRNSLKTTAAAFMLVALTGLTGCATTRDLDTLKAMVEKAQATADAAAASAAAANSSAAEALACCKANTERMDRMFKDSMNK